MKSLVLAAVGAGAIGLLGCAGPGVAVRTQPTPGADYTAISRYGWHPSVAEAGGGSVLTRETEQRIRHAIEAELGRKGLQFDPADPDVRIGYSAAVERELDVQTVNQQYGYAPGFGSPTPSGPGYRRYAPGWAPGGESIRFYPEGTLVVDILDAESGQPLWRASAQAEIHRDLPASERDQRLEDALRRMLKGFKD